MTLERKRWMQLGPWAMEAAALAKIPATHRRNWSRKGLGGSRGSPRWGSWPELRLRSDRKSEWQWSSGDDGRKVVLWAAEGARVAPRCGVGAMGQRWGRARKGAPWRCNNGGQQRWACGRCRLSRVGEAPVRFISTRGSICLPVHGMVEQEGARHGRRQWRAHHRGQQPIPMRCVPRGLGNGGVQSPGSACCLVAHGVREAQPGWHRGTMVAARQCV
jgi:hypothetical protein